MNPQETGRTISLLRKEAGLTQAALAEALEVSDKAVSKWERGIACPDISLLPKLSILLDTDIEGLLNGEAIVGRYKWKGVLLLDEYASRYVYSKPMVYYLLQYFLLVGIRDILIVNGDVKSILGTGEQLGIRLSYTTTHFSEAVLQSIDDSNSNLLIVFGNILIYGANLTRKLQGAMFHASDTVIMKTDTGMRLPILFLPHKEIERLRNKRFNRIDDMVKALQPTEKAFARGTVAIPMNDKDEMLSACHFVRVIEQNEGREIANLEEISLNRGLIRSK